MRWIVSFLCLLFVFIFVPAVSAENIPEAKVLEQQLQQGEALAEKAISALEQGDLETAEGYWSELIDRFPNNPAVWSNRGGTRALEGKLEEAIADFDRAVELAPDAPDPYLNRGIAKEGQKHWEDAIADYNRVLALDPEDAMAYNNRGNARAGQGRWDDALADYKKASELAADFALSRANYALALYQRDRPEEAIEIMRDLVQKYPMFTDMRAALAAVLWVKGLQGEAESNWVAVVGLDSRYQDLDWVQNIRRWPPRMVDALDRFLNLEF
ncbi:MAG: tetratricopeptide repeat protein [Spirulina sp.]